jgi:hypothetical protein
MLSFSPAICYYINYVKRRLMPCCSRDDENCSSVVLGVCRGHLLRICYFRHDAIVPEVAFLFRQNSSVPCCCRVVDVAQF